MTRSNGPRYSAGPWRIRVPPNRLRALREDEGFHQLLALGRFLNSLRFCQMAWVTWAQEDTPSAQRQRSAVFLVLAGVLYEGLELIRRMGKHFRHLPAWQGAFNPYFAIVPRDRSL